MKPEESISSGFLSEPQSYTDYKYFTDEYISHETLIFLERMYTGIH